MTNNLRVTINFEKEYIKKETQNDGTHYVDLSLETATLHQLTVILNTWIIPVLK